MHECQITILDVKELCNAIADSLQEYCLKFNIDNMANESQNRWNGFLLYARRQVVQPNKELIFDGSLNKYYMEKVNQLLDFYIELCFDYEKEVSIMGFCKLSTINEDTIYSWNTNYNHSIKSSEMDTIIRAEVYKKLNKENEESLSSMLVSGKRNPVGILGALNHRHNWAAQTIAVEQRQVALVDRSSLALSTSDSQEEPIAPPTAEPSQE